MTDDIHDDVREMITAVIDHHEGVYTNPKYVGRRHLVDAVRLQTLEAGDEDDTNTELVLSPFTGSVRFIVDHEDIPSKVEWAAKIHIDGVKEPLWASYTSEYGIDVNESKHYWLREEVGIDG